MQGQNAETMEWSRAVYVVKLIHKTYDWDADLKFAAPDSATASRWAVTKMAKPDDWIVGSIDILAKTKGKRS